jgi:AraC-like DNA-binding protein
MEAPREPTVSMCLVRALVHELDQAGVPRGELLRAAGIDPGKLDALEERAPRSEIYRLCELAMDTARNPAMGLHLAERLTANSFTPVSQLMAHAADLRRAFASMLQFERLLSDAPHFELCEHADRLTIRCLPCGTESPRVQRFVAEKIVGSFFRIVRDFSARARPRRVCFEYAAPPYHEEYARVFEHTARFEQPFTGIVFDRALLEVPSPHKDDAMREAILTIAERRMSQVAQRVPLALRVQELLVEHGWPHRVEMEAAARSLRISARTLRRHLRSEGKAYHEVQSGARAVIAKRLLRKNQHTIQEIAYELGFSDSTTFHRAFKRWTGMTPGAYRERS